MTHWDRYEVLRALGSGSFGQALLARTRAAGELVVIKVQQGNDARALAEVKTLQKLVHKHIVRFYDAWCSADPPKWAPGAAIPAGLATPAAGAPGDAAAATKTTSVCIVMEYCDGGDLRQAIRRRRQTHPDSGFEEATIRRWLMQMLSALHYCHTQHILHRDLKAENVLIQGDAVKLADFGLCRTLQDTTAFAETRVGTPHYLPPEVYNHAPYNHAADLWCLGVLLYELLTLKRPFVADTVAELWDAVVHDDPPCVVERSQGRYGEDLYRLCKKLLSKNPMKRPTTAEILGETFREDVARGAAFVCHPSEADAERQEAAWQRLVVTAQHRGSKMLELSVKETKLNVREAPSFHARLVGEIGHGDVVEKIGAMYDDNGTAWFKLTIGYCIAKNPKPPGNSLFREVCEWRVKRPGDDGVGGGGGSGDVTETASVTTLPRASSTSGEAQGEKLAQAALEKRFRSRSQRLQYLMSFLAAQGVDDRLADDLLTRHVTMASPEDDSAWSVYCCNALRPLGRVYCVQILRAAAEQMREATKENDAM